MRRFSFRTASSWSIAVSVVAATGVAACGASPVGGPDPAQVTYFKGTGVDALPIPFRFLFPGHLNFTYLVEARLVRRHPSD